MPHLRRRVGQDVAIKPYHDPALSILPALGSFHPTRILKPSGRATGRMQCISGKSIPFCGRQTRMKALMSATVAFLAMAQIAWADAPSPVGRTVKDFSLKDFRGTAHALADVASSKVVVIAFLGTECPLAKQYGSKLAELAGEYEARGVAFLGINSNRQDSVTEIAAYARDSQIKFPILKDLGNIVADQLGAIRTPEVFVLDEERVVRYWGRIDDRYGVGYARGKSVKNHLQD